MSIAHNMVLAARECLGTPFQHQGRVPGVGLDCVGVAIYAAREVGLNPVDVQGYGETPNNGALRTALNSQPDLESVPLKDTPQEGDILLFRLRKEPQHVGICTGTGVIHAYSVVGMCCEHDLCSKWLSRIVGIYRVKELT